jgi:hypothetical protein
MSTTPIKEIGHLFSSGLGNFRAGFLAYHPDSQTQINEHPEFGALLEKFRAGNRRNNGGDITRLWALVLNIKQVLKEGVEGDFAELGVWRGNTAAVLAHFAQLHGRKTDLFDTFNGFSERDFIGLDADRDKSFSNTSVDFVRNVIGVNSSNCQFNQGYFPDTITEQHRNSKYAVVSLDADLYQPLKAGLEFFYPRMSQGGILFFHDYSSQQWKGASEALDEWVCTSGEKLILMPDKSGSAFFRKARQ